MRTALVIVADVVDDLGVVTDPNGLKAIREKLRIDFRDTYLPEVIVFIRSATQVPRGPRGEKRPADVIGGAVKVMRIATGEEDDTLPPDEGPRLGGIKGGKIRAQRLSPERRQEIAKQAAEKRWRVRRS